MFSGKNIIILFDSSKIVFNLCKLDKKCNAIFLSTSNNISLLKSDYNLDNPVFDFIYFIISTLKASAWSIYESINISSISSSSLIFYKLWDNESFRSQSDWIEI